MNQASLVYPMFAMVTLTAIALGTLFRRRVRAVRAGLVPLAYFGTYQNGPEPEATAQASRHFVNLFEAPVLFYVVCVAAMVTQQSSTTMVTLAWVYVAARLAHSWIHLGSNRIGLRLRAYFGSWLVLAAMWVVLLAGVLRANA
jgi:hypothetical protein